MAKHGFIFACTNKSEKESLENLTFATNRAYGHRVFSIKKDDFIFLYNLDTDTLYGVFLAEGEGFYDEESTLFGGKYPYQVRVRLNGQVYKLKNASRVFRKLSFNWRNTLSEYGARILSEIISGKLENFDKIKKQKIIDENYRPPIFSTTLWDYPKQSYGDTPKGDNKYPGVTPAFIIYNLVHRYTKPGDIILDPMAGSGTTIDVCREEKRRVIALDIVPTRKDIIQADARFLPLKDESIDMIFIDSPYGDNIKYNDHPDNIGHISAADERFYVELEKVIKESNRVLKMGKYIAWLIGDQWAKGVFIPVGFKVYEILSKYFKPVDIVVVVRRNQASNTPFWHSKALQHNFFLRGFKYLLIFQKAKRESRDDVRSVRWNFYERKKRKEKVY